MTKPAKPGSFRKFIEDKIHAIPGCVDIDDLMRREPESKKADYLLYDRNVIVEQKEYGNSPQHMEKGRRYQEYVGGLFKKYGIDADALDDSNRDESFGLLSAEEVAHLRKLKNDFYDKIKDEMHKANIQIQSTKRVLGLPDAVGVVLVIFDRVNGIMPDVISQRVFRAFDILKEGEPLYKHVDVFIYSLYMRDLLYNGHSQVNGQITREGSLRSIEYARRILDDLGENKGSARPYKTVSKDDIVKQLVPNVFEK